MTLQTLVIEVVKLGIFFSNSPHGSVSKMGGWAPSRGQTDEAEEVGSKSEKSHLSGLKPPTIRWLPLTINESVKYFSCISNNI